MTHYLLENPTLRCGKLPDNLALRESECAARVDWRFVPRQVVRHRLRVSSIIPSPSV
jgi:hypothetical protein